MSICIKFISTNVRNIQKGKIREITQLFKEVTDKNMIQLESVGYPVQEIQGTPDEIILDKIEKASKVIPGPIMIEDTCLFFEAWNTLPGPYI